MLGNLRVKPLPVLLTLLVFVPFSTRSSEAIGEETSPNGRKLALLVGVDKYHPGSGFGELRFTVRDVEELAKVLIESGYRSDDVRLLTLKRGAESTLYLPTLRYIQQQIKLILADRKPEDSILIALSGHGIARRVKTGDADTSTKLASYFCPLDAEGEDLTTLLSLDDLYESLSRCKAGTKVMLVDACRNEPSESRRESIAFAPEPPPPSVAALFACSDGEVAWEDAKLGGGHGVFFHYVIEGLKGDADRKAGNRDGTVTLAELTSFTQENVSEYASIYRGKRQMPKLFGDTGRISLLSLSPTAITPSLTSLLVSKATGMRLKLIPAGEFEMGSPKGGYPPAYVNEFPQHKVRISRPFYLGVTEVTQAQYRAVTRENPSTFKGLNDQPVEHVSWLESIKYCNRLSELEGLRSFYRIANEEVTVPEWNGEGYRLPTEAEWEYACRAGSTTRYHFGDDTLSLSLYEWSGEVVMGDNPKTEHHAVAGKRPNAFGLYDMHGNVMEWCWDWYEGDYYANSPAADPHGPNSGDKRIYRGGSWIILTHYARSANRSGDDPKKQHFGRGFRIARSRSSR